MSEFTDLDDEIDGLEEENERLEAENKRLRNLHVAVRAYFYAKHLNQGKVEMAAYQRICELDSEIMDLTSKEPA